MRPAEYAARLGLAPGQVEAIHGELYLTPSGLLALLDPDSLGSRIREARGRAGLDQEALARRLGVSQSVVSKYERGRAHPRDLRRVIRVLASLEPAGDVSPSTDPEA